VFIKDEMNHSKMGMMHVALMLLTVPFIFYAKDIADSLRDISGRNQNTFKGDPS
jgi:hypothetical protein